MRIKRTRNLTIFTSTCIINLPHYSHTKEIGLILGSIHDFELFLAAYNIYIDKGIYIEMRE